MTGAQLKALGLKGDRTSNNGYYYSDPDGYWVDYGSFTSTHVANYEKITQLRDSDNVRNVVNEIAPSTGDVSATVTTKSGITFTNLNAITWDTLSWSDNSSSSASWHLNGEVRLCKIKFDLNDDESTQPDVEYAVYNTTLKTGWPTTPTREGYEFDGWYTEKTDGDRITQNNSFTANTTLYAHWNVTVPSTPTQSVWIANQELNATNKYYHNGTNGAPGEANAVSEGANATFEPTSGTLTLHNLDVTTAGKGIQWEYSSNGAHDLIITLDEGTDNKVVSTADGAIGSYRGDNTTGFGPSLTIQGSGILDATGANSASGIWAWKNITIKEDVTVYAAGGINGIANNSTIGMITIQDNAKVIASGGKYGIGYSNEYANIPEIKGGALVVSGGTAAMMKAPVIDKSFDNIRGGASQDGTNATQIAANDINGTNIGTYRYLKIVKGHTHCICGETHQAVGDHKRIELITFKAWDNTAAEAQELEFNKNLPENTGNYYLTENIGLTKHWQPAAETVLCLNGKTIEAADSSMGISNISMYVNNDNISITSCESNAKIKKSSTAKFHDGLAIAKAKTLNLYNIAVTAFDKDSVAVRNYGTFNMYSGAIQGNPGYESVSNDGVFNMYGGIITGNTSRHGGVYNNGTLNLSGNVNITGNSPANIKLINGAESTAKICVGEDGLNAGARIGISLYYPLADGEKVTVVQKPSAAYAGNFFADAEEYEIVADTQNNSLVLQEKKGTTSFTVTFEPSGGSVTPTTATTNAAGKLESLPTPTRDRYTFNGWYTERTGGMKIMQDHVFEGNTTIYAQWIENSTENTFTVTFDPSSGSVTPTTATTNTAGKLESFPTPTRDGFTFVGWYTAATGGEKIENSYIFTDNATIYAQWTKNGSSGGSGSSGGASSRTDVTTTGSTDSKVTSSPSKVKNETTTDANGNSVTTAIVTVSSANQREILKQAKANKSGEIIIKVSQNEVKDGAKLKMNLDKSFIESILNDTDAKLTVQTPSGERTFTQEELKKLAESTSGNMITIDPAAGTTAPTNPTEPTEPTNPSADKNAKLVKGVERTTIVLKSKLTKDGKVLLTWTKLKGYKVDKFEVYRSVKRHSGYGTKAFFTTKDGSRAKYLNTKNLKAGKTYYYKVRGVRTIGGKKYYTQWSNKAWRTVK